LTVAGCFGGLLLAEILPEGAFRLAVPISATNYEMIPSILIALAPFVFVPLVWLSRDLGRFRLHLIDCMYGATVFLSLGYFLVQQKSFQPVNPVFMTVANFFLYLCIRVGFSRDILNFRVGAAALLLSAVLVKLLQGFHQIRMGFPLDGGFLNENVLAIFLSFGVPLALSLAWSSRGNHLLVVTMVVFAVLLTVLVLTTTCRTAVLGCSSAVLIMFVGRYWPSIQDRVSRSSIPMKVAAGSAGLLGAITGFGFLFLMRPDSVTGRFLVWRICDEIFKDYYLIGVGIYNLPTYLAIYQGRYFERLPELNQEVFQASIPKWAFNEYLTIAAEFGLLGLIFWVPLWIAILFVVWQSVESRDDPVGSGFAGVVIIYLVAALFYFPREVISIEVFFVISLAMAVNSSQVRKNLKCRAS